MRGRGWRCAWQGVAVCMAGGVCMVGCVFMAGGMRGSGVHGGHAWQGVGGMHGRGGMCGHRVHEWRGVHGRGDRQILRDTGNERAVRILLECILVYALVHPDSYTSPKHTWSAISSALSINSFFCFIFAQAQLFKKPVSENKVPTA